MIYLFIGMAGLGAWLMVGSGDDRRRQREAAAIIGGIVCVLFVLASLVPAHSEEGIASVYGSESGSRRADGRRFRPSEIGCAHKTRRLGSVVRVTVIATGRSISCPINDRGPYVKGRILDLSTGAARALGVRGLARVRVD